MKKLVDNARNYVRDCLPRWRKMAAPGHPSDSRAPPILSVTSRVYPKITDLFRFSIAERLNIGQIFYSNFKIYFIKIIFSKIFLIVAFNNKLDYINFMFTCKFSFLIGLLNCFIMLDIKHFNLI